MKTQRRGTAGSLTGIALAALAVAGALPVNGAILGFEFDVSAKDDRTGIVFGYMGTASGAAAIQGSHVIVDSRDGVTTGLGPLPGVSGLAAGSPAVPTALAVGSAVGDPFKARLSASLQIPDLQTAESAEADAVISFLDRVRLEGPGSGYVPVTFVMDWNMNVAGFVPGSFPASALGIYDDYGDDTSYGIGKMGFSFLLSLEVEGSEDSVFFANYSRTDYADGDILRDQQNQLVWKFAGARTEVYSNGDGTFQFDAMLPLLTSVTSYAVAERMVWSYTAMVPLNQDLLFSGSWGGYVDCDAPGCAMSFLSLNSAVMDVLLPEGYSLTSAQGFGYRSSNGQPPIGGEVPEPATAVMLAAGLGLAVVLRRRRGVAMSRDKA